MPNTNSSFLEGEMQEKVAAYFANQTFIPSDLYLPRIVPKVYREVRIPQINRISDVVIYITDRKIVNIECKLSDYNSVFKQAKDHLQWADYSYMCLPPDNYLPAYILDKMITHGIGLLFWTPDFFVEVLQSGHNKNKDKALRKLVIDRLKKRQQIITGKKEEESQLEIF